MATRVKIDVQVNDSKIFAGIGRKRRVTWQGKPITVTEGVRAILEAGAWRIDFKPLIAGVWAPWEPIHSEPIPTKREAVRAIRAYLAAMPEAR